MKLRRRLGVERVKNFDGEEKSTNTYASGHNTDGWKAESWVSDETQSGVPTVKRVSGLKRQKKLRVVKRLGWEKGRTKG